MTAYSFGDIILVGFPHADLQHTSKRPALVLYDSGDQDILVARITTQQYSTEADTKLLIGGKAVLLQNHTSDLGNRQLLKSSTSSGNWVR